MCFPEHLSSENQFYCTYSYLKSFAFLWFDIAAYSVENLECSAYFPFWEDAIYNHNGRLVESAGMCWTFFFIWRRQRSHLSNRNCKHIQKVSHELREASQYQWCSFFYIVQKAVKLSIIDYLKICKTVSYSLTKTAQLVSRGFLRKKYPWQMITSNNDMTEWERHSWNDAEHKFHRKQ